MVPFQPNFFWMFRVTVLTKVTYRNFEISNLIYRKIWNLTMWPMGKFQNAIPPTVMVLLQPNFFWMFHVTALTKVPYRNFETSKLLIGIWKRQIAFKKKRLKFNNVANGKNSTSRPMGILFEILSLSLPLSEPWPFPLITLGQAPRASALGCDTSETLCRVY